MVTDAVKGEGDSTKRPRFLRFSTVAFVVLLFFAGVFARGRLLQLTDESRFDPTPLPRPKLNAPFIKSADEVVDKMIEVAEVSEKDLVYDLGCGDGKIVISAAVQRGCHGVGFDIDPKRIAEAVENAKSHQVEHLVTFKEEDIFKVDLSEANVIVMYLLPWMVRDLVPQFDRCPPGIRIVSHDWKIEGVQEEKTIEVPYETNTHQVHLYITPLKKAPGSRP